MIYRTEMRNAVIFEQSIDEKELIEVINSYLIDNNYLLNKEDPESVPELNLDFILSILNGRLKEEDNFVVYEQDKTTLTWNWWWIDDVVIECIDDYFTDAPLEIIDFGDFSDVRYEEGA